MGERLQWRRRKAAVDYVPTDEEKRRKRQSEMMWEMAQRRGTDDTVSRVNTAQTVRVELAKPLGIDFVDDMSIGIYVGNVMEGFSAFQSLQVVEDDVLLSVNGKKVSGKSVEQILQMIDETEGLVGLELQRTV